MRKTPELVSLLVFIGVALPFLGGCLMLRWVVASRPNTTLLVYRSYGVVARSEQGKVHRIECDVQNNSVITSIVCRVESVEYVLYDKHDPSREFSRMKYGDEFNAIPWKSVLDGPAGCWIRDKDVVKDCGHRVRSIVVNNPDHTGVVMRMRIDEKVFEFPCDEKDFIKAMSRVYVRHRVACP